LACSVGDHGTAMPFTSSARWRQEEARDELRAPLLDKEEVELVGAREDLYARIRVHDA
jgi:hypothetical protein